MSGNNNSEDSGNVNTGTIPLPDEFESDEFELSALDVKEFSEWEPPKPATDVTLWRYLNFTQLVSILERHALWFNNVQYFDDPYEGIWESIEISEESESGEMSEEEKTYVRNSLLYINCWHENSNESAALWEQYIQGDTGVAIKTNVGNLVSSIEQEIDSLTHGEVRYIDYSQTEIPRTSSLSPAFHKRKSYEHENEVRLAFFDYSQSAEALNSVLIDENEYLPDHGHYVDVDVGKLIGKLHISPTAPDWFTDLVKDLVSTYDQEIKIVKSDLFDDPIE